MRLIRCWGRRSKCRNYASVLRPLSCAVPARASGRHPRPRGEAPRRNSGTRRRARGRRTRAADDHTTEDERILPRAPSPAAACARAERKSLLPGPRAEAALARALDPARSNGRSMRSTMAASDSANSAPGGCRRVDALCQIEHVDVDGCRTGTITSLKWVRIGWFDLHCVGFLRRSSRAGPQRIEPAVVTIHVVEKVNGAVGSDDHGAVQDVHRHRFRQTHRKSGRTAARRFNRVCSPNPRRIF